MRSHYNFLPSRNHHPPVPKPASRGTTSQRRRSFTHGASSGSLAFLSKHFTRRRCARSVAAICRRFVPMLLRLIFKRPRSLAIQRPISTRSSDGAGWPQRRRQNHRFQNPVRNYGTDGRRRFRRQRRFRAPASRRILSATERRFRLLDRRGKHPIISQIGQRPKSQLRSSQLFLLLFLPQQLLSRLLFGRVGRGCFGEKSRPRGGSQDAGVSLVLWRQASTSSRHRFRRESRSYCP